MQQNSFSLCQRDALLPDPEVWVQGFRQARGLTALDARIGLAQAHGILADRLDRATAEGLRAHLASHGYETVVVADADLTLPRAFHLRRAELNEDALVVYDVYGRPTPFDWGALLVAHVGCYPQGEIVTTKEAGWETRGDVTVSWDAEHDVVETEQISLELVVGPERKRYAIAPSPFDYRYLGERLRNESRENFSLLLGDLATRRSSSASGLWFRVADDGLGVAEMRRYPSRRLFERHLKWLAWHASTAG